MWPEAWTLAVRGGGAVTAFIKDYQTLIAGLIAIAAAYLTARPVWRQLDRMSVQTNTMFRAFLSDRIESLKGRRRWLAKHLDPYRSQVTQRLYEMRELEERLNVHWIFERAQITDSLVETLETYRSERRDAPAITAATDEIVESLTALAKDLHAIHRPASTDQSGEDYAYSDAEWAVIEQAAVTADKALDALVARFVAGVAALDEAFRAELDDLRDRMSQTDKALLGR